MIVTLPKHQPAAFRFGGVRVGWPELYRAETDTDWIDHETPDAYARVIYRNDPDIVIFIREGDNSRLIHLSFKMQD